MIRNSNYPGEALKRLSQKQTSTIILAAGLIFCVGFLVGKQSNIGRNPPPSVTNSSKNQPADTDFGLFWEAWNKVSDLYIATPNDQQRVYGAITGMAASLDDPYTLFMPPDETKKFNEEINGNFEGIGAELVMKEGILTVVSPLDNSPATKSGLLAGDMIIKINDEDVTASISESVTKIRGPKGTVVKLTVVRSNKPVELTITRDRVDIKSVVYINKNGIGVIKINQFTGNTIELLDQSLKQAEKDQVKGLVIDVRNDPGGLLDVAVSVTSRFIEPGIVVIERDKDKKETTLSTDKKTPPTKLPVVVVINKGSASAAEIFAGAIQDYSRGKLVGETSFGKGSVQSVQTLSDGSSLRVTIAEWLTPKKREINKIGIKPDIEVKLSDEDIAGSRDPQLDKALELLK